jgi:predicted metal-dependent HD superfamily phosphohydrolase
MENLKTTWHSLVSKYRRDDGLIAALWQEIDRCYGEKHRHYHILEHIDFMIQKSVEHRNKLDDPDTVLFSIFYHDIVYEATRTDNEEKSATLANDRLTLINVSAEMNSKCGQQIMATKNHMLSTDGDTNYLLDFDLAILGETPEQYNNYAKKIRKEYSFYPDGIYYSGRRKILQHFLDMEEIFKTEEFQTRYEQQARNNIMMELDMMR